MGGEHNMEDDTSHISKSDLKPESTRNKKAIFILGMHRSGTSALTGVMAALGAKLPATIMPAKLDNPKGFFESLVVMKENDRVLSLYGSAWDDWRPISLGVGEQDAEIQASLVNVLNSEFGGAALVALKDPRICRLAPLWLGAAIGNGFDPCAILIFRDPLETALSLLRRDKIPIAHGLLLWLRHFLDAEYYTREVTRTILHMRDLIESPLVTLDNLTLDLGINWPTRNEATESAVQDFVEKELVHIVDNDQRSEFAPLLNGWISNTYNLLGTLSKKPYSEESLEKLDEIRIAFSSFSPLLTAFGKSNERHEVFEDRSEMDKMLNHKLERLHSDINALHYFVGDKLNRIISQQNHFQANVENQLKSVKRQVKENSDTMQTLGKHADIRRDFYFEALVKHNALALQADVDHKLGLGRLEVRIARLDEGMVSSKPSKVRLVNGRIIKSLFSKCSFWRRP